MWDSVERQVEQNTLLKIRSEKKKAILQEFTDPKLSDFIKNLFICVLNMNKGLQVWNDMRVSN